MVIVLVGQQYGVELIHSNIPALQSRRKGSRAESRIDKQAASARFHQHGITAAAARKGMYFNSHTRDSPRRREETKKVKSELNRQMRAKSK